MKFDGRFLLRLEDIDHTRTREAFVDAILEDLTWLGLTWDEPVLRQSRRLDAYACALDTLKQLEVVYPCAATRAEIRARVAVDSQLDPDGAPVYRPICSHRKPQDVADAQSVPPPPARPPCAASVADAPDAFAWRLDMAAACACLRSMTGSDRAASSGSRRRGLGFDGRSAGGLAGVAIAMFDPSDGPDGPVELRAAEPASWGDAIIARRDIKTSYHLAVVVDDAFQGVTHVTRGRDLERATDLHRLLQSLLGLPEPIYHHHELVRAESGLKLSKSVGDVSLRELRRQGWTPGDVRRAVGLA